MVYYSSFGVVIFLASTGVGFASLLISTRNNYFECPACGEKVIVNNNPPKSCPKCDAGNREEEKPTISLEEERHLHQDFEFQIKTFLQWSQKSLAINMIVLVIALFGGIMSHAVYDYLRVGLGVTLILHITGLVRHRVHCPSCKKNMPLAFKTNINFCPHCHLKLR